MMIVLKNLLNLDNQKLNIYLVEKGMSFTKNMIYSVWRTKNNYTFLKEPYKKIIIGHIIEYSMEKGIRIDILNGHMDHLHCLYELPPDMTLIKSLMYFKGESSHWINEQKMFNIKFGWAAKYYAVSVSPSDCESVRKYIRNQESHHKYLTWNQLVNKFLDWYGVDIEE